MLLKSCKEYETMRQSQAEPQDPRGSLANAMRIVHTISGQKRGDTTFDLRRNPDLKILSKAGITAGATT